MNIHDELHRLILRKRWICWLNRQPEPWGLVRVSALSLRLAWWRPTWEQRALQTAEDWS